MTSMKSARLHFFAPTINHATCRSLIGEHYVATATGYSVRVDPVELDGSPTIIFSESYMGPTLMGAIGKFRNHVKGRVAAGLVQWCEREPVYTAVGPALRAANADPARCCEIDLTAAYLTAARDIGAISPDIYRWILKKFNKESRLKIVGSLGTQHTIRSYRHGKEIGKPKFKPYDADTRKVWDSIVAYTDKIMATLRSAAGRDFLYYWADAIFVRPSARKRVADAARLLGFQTKHPTKIYTLSRSKTRPHGLDCSDGRPFSTPAMKAVEMMRKVGL